MKKEYCFGIVPLTYRENDWKVFLVQHHKGNYWGFPKGHGYPGESPKQSAERELKEETAMSIIRYLPHSYLIQSYKFEREGESIEKHIQYYLAEVTPAYLLGSPEIIQGKWIAFTELLSYATFTDETKLFQQVINILKQNL